MTSNQSTHAPRLPYDVLLEIFNASTSESSLTKEYIAILSAFSLVSRSFVVFCQKRLFRRYHPGRNAERCYNILQQSPHLILYVREIYFCLYLSLSNFDQAIFRLLTSVEELWVGSGWKQWPNLNLLTRQSIIALLRRPEITSLTVQGVEQLPLAFLYMWRFIKYLRVKNANPSLDLLELEYNSEPTEDSFDVILPTDFERLSLSSSRVVPEDSVTISFDRLLFSNSDHVLLYMLLQPDQISPHERDLSVFALPPPSSDDENDFSHHQPEPAVNNEDSGFSHLQPEPAVTYHFSFTKLRYLRVDITPNNLHPFWSLISEAHDSLETLDIRQRFSHGCKTDPFGFHSGLLPDTSPVILPKPISLEALVQLKTLAITILIQDYMPIHYDTLSSWCSLLRTAPRDIRFLHITLEAFYFTHIKNLGKWFKDERLTDDDHISDTPFTSLDEILSNPIYFPALERVAISVILPDDEQSFSSNSEYGFVEDDITEDDIAMYDNIRLALCERDGEDLDDDAEEELIDEIDNAFTRKIPTVTANDDENIGWPGSYPFTLDEIENSIGNMLGMTKRRLRHESLFSVDIDFGHHMHYI